MAETEALGMLPAAGSPVLSNQLLAAHPSHLPAVFCTLARAAGPQRQGVLPAGITCRHKN